MDSYRSLSYQQRTNGTTNNTTNTNADNTNRFDDLLIFGYACKLFRDDERALYIDQGKHLIPWMGDSTLKIDRFDVRAELPDVSRHEAPPGGYDNRLEYLSAAEQRAEQLCEEERYYSLYNNDFEEGLYKEEEQKREQTGYGQIGFNYDQPSTSNTQDNEQKDNNGDKKDEESDEPFVPNPKFYIPPDMARPETTKAFAIIEKTAKFIATQGLQMEILVKAKQANNIMFDFLNLHGRLNPFYKHMVQLMKDDNYPAEGGQYVPPPKRIAVIPRLPAPPPSIPIPVVKYKPSADCAYTQLISRIKGVPIGSEFNSRSETASPIGSDSNSNDSLARKDGKVEVKAISNGLMLAQAYLNSDSEDDDEDEDAEVENINGHQVSPLDAPVPPSILCPPADMQVIIDKTAAYVLKNGTDFENVLRAKNDGRFTFLDNTDQYHRYYKFRVSGQVIPKVVATPPPPPRVSTPNPTPVPVQKSAQTPSKSTLPANGDSPKRKVSTEKPAGPVSFALTASTTIKSKPALGGSSDEDDSAAKKKLAPPVQAYVPSADLPLPANFQQANFKLQATGTPSLNPPSLNSTLNSEQSFNSSTVDQTDSFIRDTILEQQNVEEKKQAKRAEDKVRNRLAQIAREKLGIVSKEKQLQLERKKKAMEFLAQIGDPSSAQNALDDAENCVAPESDGVVSEPAAVVSVLNGVEPESTADKPETNDNSDSDESVTFVSATPASPSAVIATRQRNIRKQRNDDNDDDDDNGKKVIEIGSRSRSRSRRSSRSSSRSRSRSVSKHRHKKKSSKKKSSRRRSRSRSRSKSRKSRRRYSRSRSRSRGRKSKKRRSRSRSHSRRQKRRRYSSSD